MLKFVVHGKNRQKRSSPNQTEKPKVCSLQAHEDAVSIPFESSKDSDNDTEFELLITRDEIHDITKMGGEYFL